MYDDVTVDADGFGAAGSSARLEVFEPEVVSISSFDYIDGQLRSVTSAEVTIRPSSSRRSWNGSPGVNFGHR